MPHLSHDSPLAALALSLRRDPRELTAAEASVAVDELANPTGDEETKAGFLLALRAKGETAGELAAFAAAMLARAGDPGIDPARLPGPALDVCGTGGDRLDLFNISTAAMFILAAGGATVLKHGNRAVTSRSGGADVLAALGVPLTLAPERARAAAEELGVCFLFAPDWHPAFRAIAPVRRRLAALGQGSVFNLLGPLLNPARPAHQLAGVFAEPFVEIYARAFAALGRRRAWAVHGRVHPDDPHAGGMDEVSPLAQTFLGRSEEGAVSLGTLHPEDFGLSRGPGPLDALRGGMPAENARLLAGILRGEIRDVRRDAVLLNAAAGFIVAGLVPDPPDALEHARAQIASGAAWRRLEALREFR